MELVETRLKGCYHLKAKNQYELTSTLMRIQEFYESNIDGIRGAYFDIEEFMDAYAEEHGTFSYFEDWVGFNLHNKTIRKFFRYFPTRKLTKKEKAFKKILAPLLKSRKKFSIIATYEKPTKPYTTFEHELAHGLYYLNVKYKRKMDRLTNSLQTFKKSCFKVIMNMGYAEDVCYDETQAFLATSSESYLKKKGFDKVISKPLIKQYREIFEEYKEQI